MKLPYITVDSILHFASLRGMYNMQLCKSMYGWHVEDGDARHQVLVRSKDLDISIDQLRKHEKDTIEWSILNKLFDRIDVDMEGLIHSIICSMEDLPLENQWVSPNVSISTDAEHTRFILRYKDVEYNVPRKRDTKLSATSESFNVIMKVLNLYFSENYILSKYRYEPAAVVYDHCLDIDEELVNVDIADKIYTVLSNMLPEEKLKLNDDKSITIRDTTFTYCEDRLLKYNVTTSVNALDLYRNNSIDPFTTIKRTINSDTIVFIHALIKTQYM